MLDRTMRVARERHVVAQVEPVLADVGSLPFPDDEFDLVVSFTGLHCFPDPHLAVQEIGYWFPNGGSFAFWTIHVLACGNLGVFGG